MTKRRNELGWWALITFLLICAHGYMVYTDPVARAFASGFIGCMMVITAIKLLVFTWIGSRKLLKGEL